MMMSGNDCCSVETRMSSAVGEWLSDGMTERTARV